MLKIFNVLEIGGFNVAEIGLAVFGTNVSEKLMKRFKGHECSQIPIRDTAIINTDQSRMYFFIGIAYFRYHLRHLPVI